MVIIDLNKFYKILEGRYSGIVVKIKENIEKARKLESLLFQLREYFSINIENAETVVVQKEFEKNKDAVIVTEDNIKMIIDGFESIKFRDEELQEFYETAMKEIEKINDAFECAMKYKEFIDTLKQKIEERIKKGNKVEMEAEVVGIILEDKEIKYSHKVSIEIVP